MKKIQVYIISWPGQHEQALKITRKLESFNFNVTVVYSDPNPVLDIFDNSTSIERPNELFWADKFQACIDTFDSDIMMVIHADCDCDNWELLVLKCQSTMSNYQNIGVWAPLIDNTYFKIDKTFIGRLIGAPTLNVVAQTDGIVFAIERNIVQRMKLANYDNNKYGWGIEWMFVSYAYSTNKLVVIDESVHVAHSYFRAYPSEIAYDQMNDFLNQLNLMERVQFTLLNSYVNGKV